MTPAFGRSRARVVLVQRRLVNYRLPLFERMREDLRDRSITFQLVHGDPLPEEVSRGDAGELPWADRVKCRYWLGGRICTLDIDAIATGADLLIAPSENRLLSLQLSAALGWRRIAFWGHGRNFQAPSQYTPSELFKSWIARRAPWWFAYTETSATVLRKLGFPESRIVVVNNASDTREIASHLSTIGPSERQTVRRELGIGDGPVGIAIQSLHRDKRLSLLFDAADEVRRQIRDFELLVLGDGPERTTVRHAAERSGGWIHWLGPRFGVDKARLLALAQVMLNPGMIGLGVLDAMVASLPIVTCETSRHSPEIEYLRNGVNGILAPDDAAGYAAQVVKVLQDEPLHARLSRGAAETASMLTIENMAQRFCDGIDRCLAFYPPVSERTNAGSNGTRISG